MRKGERYCPNCEQYVKPEKDWSYRGGFGCLPQIAIIFLVGILFGPVVVAGAVVLTFFMGTVAGLALIASLLVYFLKKPHCPICGTKNLYESEREFDLKGGQ